MVIDAECVGVSHGGRTRDHGKIPGIGRHFQRALGPDRERPESTNRLALKIEGSDKLLLIVESIDLLQPDLVCASGNLDERGDRSKGLLRSIVQKIPWLCARTLGVLHEQDYSPTVNCDRARELALEERAGKERKTSVLIKKGLRGIGVFGRHIACERSCVVYRRWHRVHRYPIRPRLRLLVVDDLELEIARAGCNRSRDLRLILGCGSRY